jgi:serine/threonine protein kinase
MTDGQKREFAHQLRTITDRLNTPCERFNGHDVVKRALACKRWCKFPASFQAERHEYLRNYKLTDPVYVHGDLTPDNVLIDARGQLYIIDFADAVLASVDMNWPPSSARSFLSRGPIWTHISASMTRHGLPNSALSDCCSTNLVLKSSGTAWEKWRRWQTWQFSRRSCIGH